jgi:hypothetical protein
MSDHSRRLEHIEARLYQWQRGPLQVAYHYDGVDSFADALTEAVAEQIPPDRLAVLLPEKLNRHAWVRMVRDDVPQ